MQETTTKEQHVEASLVACTSGQMVANEKDTLSTTSDTLSDQPRDECRDAGGEGCVEHDSQGSADPATNGDLSGSGREFWST